jgi:hypothetical protein
MNNDDSTFKVSVSPKSKRRISYKVTDADLDLADRIDSLQRAFANERGEWERFRQEMRAKVRLLLEWRSGDG